MKLSTSNSKSAYEFIRDTIQLAANDNVPVSAILLHPRWVVRGYVFIVEKENRNFLMMNTQDMMAAVATMDTKNIVDALNVPIVEDEKEVSRVLNGVYKCAYKF